MPWSILSNNGAPLCHAQPGRTGPLVQTIHRLGIRVERTNPGHPEQNGKHERMHRSLKAGLVGVNCMLGDLAALQVYFDEFP